MEGGELFQRIQDRQDGAFTERGTISHLLVEFKSSRVFFFQTLYKNYVLSCRSRAGNVRDLRCGKASA